MTPAIVNSNQYFQVFHYVQLLSAENQLFLIEHRAFVVVEDVFRPLQEHDVVVLLRLCFRPILMVINCFEFYFLLEIHNENKILTLK